eukprot:7382459-Pyramimonas_sp.AAC.1
MPAGVQIARVSAPVCLCTPPPTDDALVSRETQSRMIPVARKGMEFIRSGMLTTPCPVGARAGVERFG